MLFDEFKVKDEAPQVCKNKCSLCGSVAGVGMSRGGTCGHRDVFEPQDHCGKIICLCSTFISAFITTTTTALVWTDSRVIQGLSPQPSHHLKTGVLTQQCPAATVLPLFPLFQHSKCARFSHIFSSSIHEWLVVGALKLNAHCWVLLFVLLERIRGTEMNDPAKQRNDDL